MLKLFLFSCSFKGKAFESRTYDVKDIICCSLCIKFL